MFRNNFPILIALLFACNGSGSIQGNNDIGTSEDLSVKDTIATKDTKKSIDAKTADMKTKDTGSDATEDADVTIPGPVEVRIVLGERTGKLSTWTFNQETRALTALDDDTSAASISWVAKHSEENVFYTTSGQSLRGYTIDEEGLINFQSDANLNAGGTHVDIDKTGKWAIVASYGGGSIEVVSLDATTKLPGVVTQTLDDNNFCIKAHQVRVAADNKYVYVPCLGNDYIRALTFDVATGMLTPTTPGQTPNGAGPRHMDFHPTKDFAYVLNESQSSVMRFSTDSGALENPETTTTLPDGTTAGSASSDIHVSADGKFLYAVNRQPLHQMAVFKIEDDASLTLVEHVPGAGEHARSFAISPDGKSLLMGNTNSSNLIIFQRDPDSGKLVFVRSVDLDGGPMFVGFL